MKATDTGDVVNFTFESMGASPDRGYLVRPRCQDPVGVVDYLSFFSNSSSYNPYFFSNTRPGTCIRFRAEAHGHRFRTPRYPR